MNGDDSGRFPTRGECVICLELRTLVLLKLYVLLLVTQKWRTRFVLSNHLTVIDLNFQWMAKKFGALDLNDRKNFKI